MRRKNLLASCSLLTLILIWNSVAPAQAVFGLSSCEKVRKQALSDQSIIKSLADGQAALIKTRDRQIAKQGFLKWSSDPNSVKEDEIRNRTLAGYKKILTAFQNLQKNQKCLKPDKYADVLSLIESYKKAVALWSGPTTSYLSNDLIKYGDLTYYLK
jgi:hypothetical protein